MTPEQFKRMRSDLRLTQVDMAELIGVSENAISLYERGKSPIPKMIKALAFGLWFENFAGYIPSFTAMLESGSDDIAKTIALLDSKRDLTNKKSMEFILGQIEKARGRG
ncbi:helix-turn-helix domain-containing protein [uncultured Limnobacter sp.]|uniref:helix-turn-helix domain-containing protein n=1 Tax=uncultured Limnobacter sp. TaxID=199681 RepID=UPI0030FACEE1